MSKEIMENDMCMEACEGVTEPMVWIPVARFEELIWSETRFCTLQTMIEEGVELPKICRVFGLDYKKTMRDRLAEAFEDAIIEKTKEKMAKAEKTAAEDPEPETEADIKAKGWTPVDNFDIEKLPPNVREVIEEAKKAHPDARVSVWTKPVELTHAEVEGVMETTAIDPADAEAPEEKHFIEIEQDGQGDIAADFITAGAKL